MKKATTFFVIGFVLQGLGNMMFLAGFLFYLFSWPGASFNMIGGVLLYLAGFLVYRMGRSVVTEDQQAKRDRTKPLKWLGNASRLGLVLGLLTIIIGMFFKMQSWPGASWSLLLGFALAEFGIIFNYLDKILQELGIGSKDKLNTLDEDMVE